MPSEQEDASYVWDMLDAAKAIREFITGRSYQDYLVDRMLRGAVERHLEIIGEAAGKVSKGVRDAHPEIPWQKIRGNGEEALLPLPDTNFISVIKKERAVALPPCTSPNP
jgi:uncharacterized protein with HEPN domain